MIIRSQDKTGIVIYENVSAIYVIDVFEDGCKKMFEIRHSGNNVSGTLGTYSTEEKAIKVLDMIQNKYFEHMTVENNGAIVNVLERPKVFQMPQDCEV